ncbi:PREDICTED: elongation of very long chain fatty acids protein AAEL008004 [Ceratosolen solmsi marchali]|uniref:Elongation of very long chain fatty acids protein n=1 Tax=Ceratosolen solmsi marchali TaxID=326594 RepID=A0AAJ6VNA0_9HYME|nr:PREDICTED: elongation of very long chain fatty acids protein AAEL008004 [Ceratosolen solmsi marchali]
MASIIGHVVSNYNEILETNKDPMVDSWLLMGSPKPLLLILGAYLTFVLKVGPKMMEKRPAFELKTVIILYNGFQVLFSIWLTILALKVDLMSLIFTDSCDTKRSLPTNDKLQSTLSVGAWWYFFSKITELMDTVFFILRKKFNQVSFLHVYHHTITAFFSWCYLKFLPGEQGIVIGFLNSFVHIVMYSYYLIAALGPEYRKYLWWKKYMTWMQLVQFAMMLVYLMFTLTVDCHMPKALTYFFLTNVIIFIYLFSDFYRKTYAKLKKI